MTERTRTYAHLAAGSYEHPPTRQTIDGVEYQVELWHEGPGGYQGALYRNTETGDLILAHRGTETERGLVELLKDGVAADFGMVRTSLNVQTAAARGFTKQASELAKERGAALTVTGHSLGGCLAQVTASHYGLGGETFNAYDAARLAHYDDGVLRIVPEGGSQVINHVRATDFVSAASDHFGKVEVYALEEDIDALSVGYGLPLPMGFHVQRAVAAVATTLEALPDRQPHPAAAAGVR